MNIYRETSLEIEKLNLSNRSYKYLKLNGINTIMELMLLSKEELITFRNLGIKSVEEISKVINNLSENDFIIKESENECSINKTAFKSPFNYLIIDCVARNESRIKKIMFYDNNGILRDDLNIDKLELSVRAKNCLTNNGYVYISQLLKLKKLELIKIKNMGSKSIEEILDKISNKIYVIYEDEERNEALNYNNYYNQIIDEYNNCSINFDMETVKYNIYMFFKKNKDFLRKEINFENNIGNEFINNYDILEMLYMNLFFREIIKSHIYNIISTSTNYVSLYKIRRALPEHLKYSLIESAIISEMIDDKKIEWLGDNLRCWYPSLLEYINSSKNKREKIIVLNRLRGKTLEEIGIMLKITRERVRQIEKKAFKRIPKLREDDYQEVFQKYDWNLETFVSAYNESSLTFTYLETVYKKGENPLELFLSDDDISPTIRRKVEKIIYKNYIMIDSSRIKLERNEILDYILRKYCKNEVTIQELRNLYYDFLKNEGLSDIEEMTYPERYLETKLANSKKVLWKYGKKLRYYDFENIDSSQIIKQLNLKQYKDVEYSTLKFFRDYSELMEEWDIRDEYELHNLMKKKMLNKKQLEIKFLKMPNIEFGTADRDMQVVDLLIQNAPIESAKLARVYEEEYGVKAETVLANHFKCIDEYYYNGVYTIDSKPLLGKQFELMKTTLINEFYFITDIKKIFNNMFPHGDIKMINPYNLKKLGFKVNSNNIYSDEYISCNQYFKKMILKDNIFDANTLDSRIRYNQTYYHTKQLLEEQYEIIEFSYNKFINIKRLEEIGINKDEFKNFNDAIFEFIGEEFFTIQSLRKQGFEHELDELGFEDWFYASLIKYDYRFKNRRLGSNILFRKGIETVSLNRLIEYLVCKFRSIDIYDFANIIFEEYGIRIDNYKIQEVAYESELYYDSIMEKVYINYDEYFEEV